MTVDVLPQFTLADYLRKARLAAGMDQAELARHLGVSRALISRYETNSGVTRRAMVIAWAAVTGVDADALLSKMAPGTGLEPVTL